MAIYFASGGTARRSPSPRARQNRPLAKIDLSREAREWPQRRDRGSEGKRGKNEGKRGENEETEGETSRDRGTWGAREGGGAGETGKSADLVVHYRICLGCSSVHRGSWWRGSWRTSSWRSWRTSSWRSWRSWRTSGSSVAPQHHDRSVGTVKYKMMELQQSPKLFWISVSQDNPSRHPLCHVLHRQQRNHLHAKQPAQGSGKPA